MYFNIITTQAIIATTAATISDTVIIDERAVPFELTANTEFIICKNSIQLDFQKKLKPITENSVTSRAVSEPNSIESFGHDIGSLP